MLLLECCTVKEAFQALENRVGQKSFTRHSEARCSANPLGQLYSLPVIKFQSFIACDKIEARGWTHTFESRTCEIVYFVVA